MGLWEIELINNVVIYVLALNKNHAIYKSYRDAIDKMEIEPSNKGFENWKRGVKNIKIIYFKELDESRFYIY